MKKKLVWGLLLVATCAIAASKNGTESGTGSNEAQACKRAKNYAETSASAAELIYKGRANIGSCQCSRVSNNEWECIVSWRVD